MTIMDLLPPEDSAPLPVRSERGAQRAEAALAHHRRRDGTMVDMEIVSPRDRARRAPRAAGARHRHQRAHPHPGGAARERGAAPPRAADRCAGPASRAAWRTTSTTCSPPSAASGRCCCSTWCPTTAAGTTCSGSARPPTAARCSPASSVVRAQQRRAAAAGRPQRGGAAAWSRCCSGWSGADVQLDVRLSRGLGQVRIDPAQLEHVRGQPRAQRARRDARRRPPQHRDRRAPDQRRQPRPPRAARPLRRPGGQRYRRGGQEAADAAGTRRGSGPLGLGRRSCSASSPVRRGGPGLERAGAGHHGQGLPAAAGDRVETPRPATPRPTRCAVRRPCWWPRTRTACGSCCARC